MQRLLSRSFDQFLVLCQSCHKELCTWWWGWTWPGSRGSPQTCSLWRDWSQKRVCSASLVGASTIQTTSELFSLFLSLFLRKLVTGSMSSAGNQTLLYNTMQVIFIYFSSTHLVCQPPSRLVNLLVENKSLYATYGKQYGQFVDNPHVDKYVFLFFFFFLYFTIIAGILPGSWLWPWPRPWTWPMTLMRTRSLQKQSGKTASLQSITI